MVRSRLYCVTDGSDLRVGAKLLSKQDASEWDSSSTTASSLFQTCHTYSWYVISLIISHTDVFNTDHCVCVCFSVKSARLASAAQPMQILGTYTKSDGHVDRGRPADGDQQRQQRQHGHDCRHSVGQKRIQHAPVSSERLTVDVERQILYAHNGIRAHFHSPRGYQRLAARG